MDEETEILTEAAWKTVHDLRPGEMVLTLNRETGMSERQPVLEICVFPAERREMILMEGRGHSSLSTPDHHWPVINSSRNRVWKTTETLVCHSRIPLAAMCASLPQDPTYTDAFVELVAWFWTEGDTPGKRQTRISQSLKNTVSVDRIDAALRSVYGPPVDRHGITPEPRWRRDVDEGRNVRFTLNAAARKVLTDVAPGRAAQPWFLRSLTQAQLGLFIRISMVADNSGPTRLHQKDRRQAEAFQFAAILAGHATSLLERVFKPRDTVPVTHDGRYSMWGVTLQKRTWFGPVDNLRQAQRKGTPGWVMARVQHDGIVWCPCTENMTWLARRNGHCYFTGAVPTGSQKPPRISHVDNDPQFRRLTAERLRAEGMTLREIARQIGVSPATVLGDLRRARDQAAGGAGVNTKQSE